MTYPAPVASSLGHLPGGEQWTFDASVARVFEDMLRRSIPQYEVMRSVVFEVGREFVQPQTYIVDLGCSHGAALAAFVTRYGDDNRYIGVDASDPMLDVARARFAPDIANGRTRIDEMDLRLGYPHAEASLTLCVLTLQFLPLDCRQRVLDAAYRNTVPGGALILIEKVLGATPALARIMTDRYHELKRANGYTAEEIERKRLSLEGVLMPVTAHSNEIMLRDAGFAIVDCTWRWMNFAGWVAVRSLQTFPGDDCEQPRNRR
jgi:tRNA (cmo5U34)-methyltransferase